MSRIRMRPRVRTIARFGFAVAIAGFAAAAASAQPFVPPVPTYTVTDLGVIPRLFAPSRLLALEAVQKEVGLTDDQKVRQEKLVAERTQKLPRMDRADGDILAFRRAQTAVYQEFENQFLMTLTPAQRVQLDQLQLQLEGPVAFDRPEIGPMAAAGPSLAHRLKLSDEQAQRARAIAQEGMPDIARAARFPLDLDTRQGPPSPEAIRAFVQSEAFRRSKRKARDAGIAVHEAVIQRIEDTLTDAQRAEYRELRGKPVDLSRLNPDDANARQADELMLRVIYRRMEPR